MSPFELDIYIPSLKKAVEYDGTYWHSKPGMPAKDRYKDVRCAMRGIQLLRISDTEHKKNKQETFRKIEHFLLQHGHSADL